MTNRLENMTDEEIMLRIKNRSLRLAEMVDVANIPAFAMADAMRLLDEACEEWKRRAALKDSAERDAAPKT